MTLSVAQLTVLAFAALLLWAAVSDALRYIIPDRVSIAIALLYPVYVAASPTPVEWLSAAGLSAVVFGAGAFAFARGWFGGGDVKLLAAAMLWAGPALANPFLFVMALCGAAMCLGFLMWCRWAPALGIKLSVPAGPYLKINVPYGVAIAGGGLYVAAAQLAAL